MSFGFSIGDFITVIELANKIRKDFAFAPEQYERLAADVKNLSIILQDVEIFVEGNDLSQAQEDGICKIGDRCNKVLDDINKALDKYSSLSTNETASTGSRFKKRARRTWQQFKFEPEEFREYRDVITTNVSMLNAFMGGITRDGVIKLVGIQNDNENQTILGWLSGADYHAQQADNVRQRLENTGRWLFESIEYKDWFYSSNKMLFLHGIPGAGKTVLSSIVIEQLQDRRRQEVNLGLVYLYCDYNRQEAQQLDKVLLSWLRQLSEVSTSMPSQVKQLYDDHRKWQTRPKLEEIKKVFHAVAKSFTDLYIVVDALDECYGIQGSQRELINELQNLNKSFGVNVLATSRPIPSIQAAFQDHPSIEVRASEDDIRRFVDINIAYLPTFVAGSSELQEEIKTGVVESAEGMFLLAKLNFESLRGKTRKKQLREALASLVQRKGDYGEAYRKTMDIIHTQLKDEKDLALEVLAWVVHSKRPLTAQELQQALAVEVDDEVIDEDNIPELQMVISVCCGLVSLQAETNIVQLIHYTTQEFFMNEKSNYLDEAKIKLSTACMAYISLEQFITNRRRDLSDLSSTNFLESLPGLLKEFPFYEYAIRYWGFHTKSACDYSLICRFLDQEKLIEISSHALLCTGLVRRYIILEDFSNFWTALHFVAYFGLDPFLQHVLSRCHIDAVNFGQRTALSYASEYGHETLVRGLLEESAQLDIADNMGRTALIYASENGHEAVVRVLLEKGAQVDATDIYGETALIEASKAGHEAAVRLLLGMSARVDIADKYGRTALIRASGRCHEAIVRLLLEKGAQVDIADQYGHTALIRASGFGYEAIVRLLVERGAQIDATDEEGRTALSWASMEGGEATVRLLLAKEAQIDIADRDGRTALMFASMEGEEATVRLLLANGAQTDIRDNEGSTALTYALDHRYENIARLLVDNGARTDIANEDGSTSPTTGVSTVS